MEKVSIIVPIYNGNIDYFDECINSLLKQTYNNIEIIIVDDGSSRNVADCCDKYSSEYNNVLTFHKKNEGVSIARNFGIKKATGKWISFVDADDWLEEYAIEEMVNIIGNADIIYSKWCINNDAPLNEDSIMKSCSPDELIEIMFYQRKLLSFCLESPWAKMFSKSFIVSNAIGFTSGIPKGEDMLFNFDCLTHANNVRFLDKLTYHYRKNDDSVTRRFDQDFMRKDKLLITETRKRFSNNRFPMNYYYFLVIRLLHRSFKVFVFNPQYSINNIDGLKIIKELAKDEVYSESIKNVELRTLGVGRKFLVILYRLHLYHFILFYYKWLVR